MRKLSTSRLIFVAGPKFVASNVLPPDPAKFAELPFLSFQEETARPSWKVTGPGEKPKLSLSIQCFGRAISTFWWRPLAPETGVALLPAQVVEHALSERRLVRILPEWHSESVTIHLVFMTKRVCRRQCGSSSTILPRSSKTFGRRDVERREETL